MDTIQAAWRLLSDETKVCILYLEQLWNDNDFRQEWTRLYESFTAKWQAQALELAEQLTLGNRCLYETCRQDADQSLQDLQQRWKTPFLPPRIVRVLAAFLVSRLFENLGSTYNLTLFALTCATTGMSLKQAIRLCRNTAHDLLSWCGLWLLFEDASLLPSVLCEHSDLPPPPLEGLPVPLPWEAKDTYRTRVEILLKREAQELEAGEYTAGQLAGYLLKEYEVRSGFRFHNLRNAIPAVLALAEDYHDLLNTRASNRTDELLRRYARQVYLRVVKDKTWGAIRDEVFKEELDDLYKQFEAGEITKIDKEKWREALRQRVIRNTEEACRLLGIPLPKKQKV